MAIKSNLLSTASAIALAIGLSTATVQAADYAAPAPVVVPQMQISNWQGWYAGAHIGVGKEEVDPFTNDTGTMPVAYQNAIGGDGYLVGITLGLNWRNNNLVWGLEADADWMQGFLVTNNFDGGDDTSGYQGDMNFLGSIRGRLGFVVDENTLISGNVGVAFSDAEKVFHAFSSDSRQPMKFDVGGVVGISAEHMVSEHLSIRADASYYFFDDESIGSGSDLSQGGGAGFNVFTLRTGVTYHW